MIDDVRLKEIICGWMKDNIEQASQKKDNYEQAGRGYVYWDWGDLESRIKEFIRETIGAMPNKGELTNEAAVEQLKKSGWLERHDAEVERRVSVNELINTVMARGDKSIRISIDPWRWED